MSSSHLPGGRNPRKETSLSASVSFRYKLLVSGRVREKYEYLSICPSILCVPENFLFSLDSLKKKKLPFILVRMLSILHSKWLFVKLGSSPERVAIKTPSTHQPVALGQKMSCEEALGHTWMMMDPV